MRSRPQVREAGDGALLLQLAAVIDVDVNARVIAIASVVRSRRIRGVRDVVSTFRSVAVYFDPLSTDAAEVAAALYDAAETAPLTVSSRHHEIPVSYGGEDGLDLDAVARRSGLTPVEVIERHAATPYRVFMLGFQPGFAYMGMVDPALAIPRRPAPRLRVPAGSVGIAGRQTGIYPAVSPGGWQIVGRALEPVFDPSRRLARFAPGDTVVFIPREARGATESAAALPIASPSHGRRVTVIRPGLFTTVQDSGSWGEQGIGLPAGGAMDPLSHAVANLAVGNDRDAAALEATIVGPELRLEQETTIAVAGADLAATLDGRPVPLQTPVHGQPGGVLRFGHRVTGARAYIAFDGGLQVERRWPSAPVAAGHTVGLGPARQGAGRPISGLRPPSTGGAKVRVMVGPHHDEVSPACVDGLLSRRFIVTSQSNRMGYRLTGEAVPSGSGEMISDATFTGAIQVPPSGEPIVLMADRQTTGGYPQVAAIITADLPLVGQLAPGDWIEFAPCSRREAVIALAEQEALVR